MRHKKEGKKFHRLRGERASFLRNLANDLMRAEKIKTTETRAKAVRPIVERLVTIAKNPTLQNRRLILARTNDKKITEKLLGGLGPRYKDKNGGYLRIIKSAKPRKRDGTRLATIEFV